MEKVKKRILDKVRDLFFKRGFSRVTMDELASELGISKKTLYNHFSGKAEMLELVVQDLKLEVTNGVDRIMLQEELDFKEKLVSILSFTGRILGNLEPEFLIDLKKSNPEVSKELEDYKREAAFNRFSFLLDEGIKKGYVKPDVNKSMAVLVYASLIEMAMNPEYISQLPEDLKRDVPFSTTEIFKGMVLVMLQGILNE